MIIFESKIAKHWVVVLDVTDMLRELLNKDVVDEFFC